MKKHEQLNIFAKQLSGVLLVAADSPRQAFYRIWIEQSMEDIRLVKESGAKDTVLDKRSWTVESLEKAQKMLERRIETKTNANRKSPRKYKLVHQI